MLDFYVSLVFLIDAPNLTQMLDPADDLGQPRVAVKDGNEIVLVKGTDELLLLREKG